MRTRTVPAGRFKQQCLAMLDEVADRHEEVIITKRGRPVARLVPIASARAREEDILGRLRAQTRVLVSDDELMKPLGEEAGWKVLRGRG
jgi:prevent-host-death family protein